jgi:hypothetical protein
MVIECELTVNVLGYFEEVGRCIIEHGTINYKSLMLLGQLNSVALLGRTCM